MLEELPKHRCILLGSLHYNNVGICKSLAEAGLNVIYVYCEGDTKPSKRTNKYIKEFYTTSSVEEGLSFIKSHFKNDEYKPFIFTGQDEVVEALNDHYDELIDHFYFNNCGSKDGVKRYVNKENLCRLAEKHGITPPCGEVVKRGEIPQNLQYPIITKVTKAATGAWKDDVYICNSKEELQSAWGQIKADEVLVQEYIRKKNELSIFGISINQGEEIESVCAVEYIRLSDKGYGFYMRAEPFENEDLKRKIQGVLREMKFSGIWGVECLIDKEDNYYFLEVNMRNDAFAYASTKYGFNLPYEWVKATLNGHIDFDKEKLKKKSFTCMVASADKMNIIRYKVSALKWLWQYITVDCLLDRDKKEPWLLCALYRAYNMGFVKMWLKSTFKLYTERDYPLAF